MLREKENDRVFLLWVLYIKEISIDFPHCFYFPVTLYIMFLYNYAFTLALDLFKYLKLFHKTE